MKLTEQTPGAIICFVGPPGVGKTSLAKSIARALGRKFLRLSLGGVRDEAEIRGHRRTYIGAMPGKIIQSMKRAGVVNPVVLLDEIDKMTMDFHGDPASALLEVLDPEQNKTFVDHYLDVDYDLSKVLFITTANFANQIPAPLYDRLEVIYLPGYLELEKIQIALRYLLPKQKKKNGIDSIDLQISEKTVAKIVNEYSREAGVRNLERDLATICRRIAVKKVKGRIGDRVRITTGNVQKYLGKPKFLPKENKESIPGRAIGLAWTQSGGDVLTLEVNMVPGKENFVLTGKLGEVMRESAQAALVYIKANTDKFGVDFERFKDKEIHLHVPEGAVPKDGPSAGITIATALLSELLQKPVSKDLAMTGEITIKGEVLPIGGLNEKIMAARRFGIEKIIIPWQNRLDLEEIKKEVKNGIEFIAVKRYEEVFDIIFG
jgi:ATP-dependent Lon protease